MIDKRTTLPRGCILSNNSKSYEIVGEIGRGANCIVYNASYLDSAGLKHLARVKELYPIYLLLERNEDFEICCNESQLEKFEDAKKRFEKSYETNIEFRNTYGVMNSTVNIADKFSSNGTLYAVMNLDEGTDYQNYTDRSLVEILSHIKALATVINKYHSDGYLHLDIKPENVFVIPETAEHVFVFDFDSVCKIEDLRNKKIVNLSYSEGFSAPEQVQGNITKIGPRTDIYAIGALLFFKLFNRKPTFDECRYSASFDYKEMSFYDERLRPAFYRCLNEILHRTLATSTLLRWNSMEQVIGALEELTKLSDVEDAYLINTFTYNSAFFVGRSDEIEEIHEKIQDNNVLFLSGIGGIGKTELAKKFISEYRGEFDTVAFVYFQETIEHTVCQEILINNMCMDEEEKESDYFERVLEALRKTTTEKDLILLDNFDVERDDRLEDLLKCPCRFLITTRNRNIKDWNYCEVKIDRMAKEDDLRALFELYNDEAYENSELHAVDDIIDFVDGHTMTVELISKYLRDSGQTPSALYERFNEKNGITNTDDGQNVNHRKDHKMNSESVNGHLSILFDIFDFDEFSKEIMSSLSLFAGIRINKKLFESFYSIDNISWYINKLIRGGWIELNDDNGKISLHQVIQDLIYTKLKPTTENCSHIAAGMYKYIKERTESYFERRIKKKVFGVFAERISGEDIPYAKICLEYAKRNKIDEAIMICQRIATDEAYSVLAELHMEKVRYLCQCDDMFESDDSLEEYGHKQIVKVDKQFELAVEACRNAYSENQGKRLIKLVELAKRMDSNMNDCMMNCCFDDVEEVDSVYQRIIEIFNQINEKMLDYKISYEEKEKILETAREFYNAGDYCAMYRWEHYSDFEKVDYYQELLNELRREKADDESDTFNIIYVGDCSYCDMADGYMADGNYEAAIKMLKKAYDKEDDPLDWILPRLSEAYLKVGEVASAVDCLIQLLDDDKRCIEEGKIIRHYSGYVCLDLIKALIDAGRNSEAEIYAHELISYIEPEIKENEDNSYYIKYVLAANWYLYYLSNNQLDQKVYWNKCKELFDQLGDAKLQEEHIGFIREYIKENGVNFNEIIDIINRLEVGYGKEEQIIQFIEEIIDGQGDKKDFRPYQIQLLIKCAEITSDPSYKGTNKPLNYCKKAEELLAQNDERIEYFRNKIIKVKSEAMSHDDTYNFDEVNAVRKQCDYYIVAEQESQNVDNEKKIKIWKDSADMYGYLDDYTNQIKCLEQAYMIMIPILNQYEYSRFDYHLWYIMYDQVTAWINISNLENANAIIKEMYMRTLDYYDKKEDVDSDYLYKVKEIAGLYERAGNHQEAFRGFLMWLYIKLSKKRDKRILKDYFSDTRDIESVTGELLRIITDDRVEIDSLIEFKEEIENIDLEDQEMQYVQSLLHVVNEKYQNKDVEFK